MTRFVQYSAASFIETINSSSLTMDADEFMARMMAAGMPDMQLLPSGGSGDAPGRALHKSFLLFRCLSEDTCAHASSAPGY